MLPRLGKVAISNAQRLSLRPVLKANLTRLPCYTPSKHDERKNDFNLASKMTRGDFFRKRRGGKKKHDENGSKLNTFAHH
jgi:hypothetical protein